MVATEDKARGKAARGESTAKEAPAEGSAAEGSAAAAATLSATTPATDDSAADERATAGASDGGAADVPARDAGGGVGDTNAATADRDAAVTADAKAGQAKSPDAKSAGGKTPDTKRAADSAEPTPADAKTRVESAQADVADRVPAAVAGPDTEDATVAEATRPVRAGAATKGSAPEGRKDAGQTPAADQSSAKQVTVVPGVPRYHTANCILIRFMGDDDLQKMPLPDATAAGCTPCRACQPDIEPE